MFSRVASETPPPPLSHVPLFGFDALYVIVPKRWLALAAQPVIGRTEIVIIASFSEIA